MPIFQEDRLEEADPVPDPTGDGQAEPGSPHPQEAGLGLCRKLSEESIRTELCDGPVLDSPPRPRTPEQDVANTVSDRAELIERLKRGESPTWVPNRHLEGLFHDNGPRPPRSPTTQTPRQPTSASPALLPPATITPEKTSSKNEDRMDDDKDDGGEADQRVQEGLNIERPRSALHSGDFTQNESASARQHRDGAARETGTPGDGGAQGYGNGDGYWLATSPPRDFNPFEFEARRPQRRSEVLFSGASSLSSSLSQSFAYQPPTSPLVQSESNDDTDLSTDLSADLSLPMTSFGLATGSPVNARRHTLNFLNSPSPSFSSSLAGPAAAASRQAPLPYQAHQPRRSLTSTPNVSLATSSPQTPAFLRSRRPSFGSDASPLQHASMVGSYEESILRGRMSTTPSRPLDFLAQIGVLGLGNNCKASLRCPSHVTLPFSAVFYSYASTAHGRTKTEDGPSPYVGQIDLENGLSNPEDEQRARRKLQSRYLEQRRPERDSTDAALLLLDEPEPEPRPEPNAFGASRERQQEKQKSTRKRRSRSPKAPPGGRYRIPEKGQLQIIIKNQNKTAVKLFLIPYDLGGMEPSTKTFIRQRSYSSGAVVDSAPGSTNDIPPDRPTLRYLVHLHICCPSRGRYYLYKSIRVVFANRVPDGKEKLHNEITHPEPRFTPYKPVRVMHPPAPDRPSGPAATLAAEKAFRRRSSGLSGSHQPSLYPPHNYLPHPHSHSQSHVHPQPPPPPSYYPFEALPPPVAGFGLSTPAPAASSTGFPSGNAPVDPIPFNLPQNRPRADANQGERGTVAYAGLDLGFRSPTTTTTTTSSSFSAFSPSQTSPAQYDKLSKGDVGYGGNAFAPLPPSSSGSNGSSSSSTNRSPGAAEGLLSKRLRSLGVHGRQVPE